MRRQVIFLAVLSTLLSSCDTAPKAQKSCPDASSPISTWFLLSGQSVYTNSSIPILTGVPVAYSSSAHLHFSTRVAPSAVDLVATGTATVEGPANCFVTLEQYVGEAGSWTLQAELAREVLPSADGGSTDVSFELSGMGTTSAEMETAFQLTLHADENGSCRAHPSVRIDVSAYPIGANDQDTCSE